MSSIRDQVQNPIPKNNLFATPHSLDSLHEHVSQLNGAELRVAMMVMNLTMNLCHKLVEQELRSQTQLTTNF